MVHGEHGVDTVHAVNLVTAVFKNVSDIVINLHQLMAVKDVLVVQRQFDHATLINVQVNFYILYFPYFISNTQVSSRSFTRL